MGVTSKIDNIQKDGSPVICLKLAMAMETVHLWSLIALAKNTPLNKYIPRPEMITPHGQRSHPETNQDPQTERLIHRSL